MTLEPNDRLLAQRHLDGQLDAAAAAAFAARLRTEPELARAVAEAQAQRDLLRAAAGLGRRASPRFAAGVVAAARALPTRLQLQQADAVAAAVRTCRRVLLAAAAVAAVGALWHAGLLGGSAPATLQASAGDVDQAIRQLDERIQSGAVPPPAGERGR
jgi:anti-sigma factor RsiW